LKIFFEKEELERWQEYINRLLSTTEFEYFCELKIDGFGIALIYENGILVNDVTLRGAFPYRNQIEQFFKNKDSNKQTFDYKGQKLRF